MTRRALSAKPPAPARVGIGQIRVARPPETLAVYGIGSCVVVFVFDPAARRGGLAHPLLPGEPPRDLAPEARGKYAPAAIRALVAEMRSRARVRSELVAKLIGGAAMFQSVDGPSADSIGRRNVEAAVGTLAALRVPLVASESGGTTGRSLIADPDTGSVEVWTLRSEIRVL